MRAEKNDVVLAIDDNQDNLLLIDLILSGNGYQVEKACCGKEGVAKIHALVPDLIILDLMMPDITGLEVIDAIKAYPHLSQIPILVCTANVQAKKRELLLLGADSICYKPFDINELLSEVNSLVGYRDRLNGSTLSAKLNRGYHGFLKQQDLTLKNLPTLK